MKYKAKRLSAAERLEQEYRALKAGLTPREKQEYEAYEQKAWRILYYASALAALVMIYSYLWLANNNIIEPVSGLLVSALAFVVLAFGLTLVGRFLYSLSPSGARHRELDKKMADYKLEQRNYWLSLNGPELEEKTVALYEQLGYDVTHTGKSGDKGIDLILRKEGETIVVQCRSYKSTIGPSHIREFHGAIKHFGLATRAVLICPIGFTEGVRHYAAEEGIELVDLNEILRLTDQIQQSLHNV